jgi:hypothetical protein
MEDVWSKSLSQRERVARASGPGEGYNRYLINVFSFLCPRFAAPSRPIHFSVIVFAS